MESDPEILLVQRIFGGRILTENESPGAPLEKMFRCTNALPGCGQAKPANAFYTEIKELCSDCATKLARQYNTGLENVSLIFSCYEITRQLHREVKGLLGESSAAYLAGFKKLVTDNGIRKGRDHFIKQMMAGTVERPADLAWFQSLHERYKKWFFTEFGVPESLYSNLPKNGLLS